MLPKENRICKKKDFEVVFKKGITSEWRFFITKTAKNKQQILRFAFVFPVKKQKKASQRNKVKRIFREIIKNQLFYLKGSCDIIFLIKKSSENRTYQEIEEEVKNFLKKKELI